MQPAKGCSFGDRFRYLHDAVAVGIGCGGGDGGGGGGGGGPVVRVKRNDSSDRTLLRCRPTCSRSDDAFVVPSVSISGDDRLVLLRSVSAEGTEFSLVRTVSGVEGYAQSKCDGMRVCECIFVTF